MRILIAAFAIILLLSCSSSKSDHSKDSELPVSINIDFSEAKELNFNEIVDSIRIIQLETKNNSLLSSIWDIKVLDSDFYIYNFHDFKLYRFSHKGDFINKYGLIGRGPGEVYSTSHFYIDSSNVYIHVRNRIVAYDLMNEKEVRLDEKVPFWATSFLKQSSGSWLFYRPRITTDSYKRFWTTDSTFSNIKDYLHPDTSITYTAKRISNISQIGEKYFLYEPGIDTIYCFSQNQISKSYVVDFGNYRSPPDFRKLDEEGRIVQRTQKEFDQYPEIHRFFITSSEIWMLIYYQRKEYLLRFNREDNTTDLYSSVHGGPDLIRSAKLLSIMNNRMYWTIPDRILLSPDEKTITDYRIQEFIEYRRKLPEESNPFIIELTMN